MLPWLTLLGLFSRAFGRSTTAVPSPLRDPIRHTPIGRLDWSPDGELNPARPLDDALPVVVTTQLANLVTMRCRIPIRLILAGSFAAYLSAASVETHENWKTLTFSFDEATAEPGSIPVSPQQLYSSERTFGIEPSAQQHSGNAAVAGDSPANATAFRGQWQFSVKVAEGNYRVTLRMTSGKLGAKATVKAESRRLMLEAVSCPAGQTVTCSFVVNVRTPRLMPPPANAPGGDSVRLNEREQGVLHWDEKLTLEFAGTDLRIQSIKIEPAPEAPTLFLIGDSTVTDQPFEPTSSWGQMLPRFLSPDVAVANHAESGETLKSFITGLRLEKVLECIKPGDFLLVQFGHNDQKEQWPQTYSDPTGTFPAYLKVVVTEARRRGATPVLVTSMHRRRLDPSGHVVDTLGAYPEAVRRVCAEEGIACVDLHAISQRIYEALGATRIGAAFVDGTHHSNYGAYVLANAVADALRRISPRLDSLVRSDTDKFDPDHPMDPEHWSLPTSDPHPVKPPRGN